MRILKKRQETIRRELAQIEARKRELETQAAQLDGEIYIAKGG